MGFGFRVSEFRVSGIGVWGLEHAGFTLHKVQSQGSRFWANGSGFRVWGFRGFGLTVQGLGFRGFGLTIFFFEHLFPPAEVGGIQNPEGV